MKLYKLKQTQQIKINIDEAWQFFSNPWNLRNITPKSLNFTIKSDLPEKMYPGMIIEYTVSPLFGIPMRWITEITQVREPHFFIDEQRFGPYKFWHHQHIFKETSRGVEMIDLVHYGLPFGIFGRIANSMIVKAQLEKIFSYRKQFPDEYFNGGEISQT